MIAKRKGVIARWGLKEAWSKDASRWTRTGYEAYGAGRAGKRSRSPPPSRALVVNSAATGDFTIAATPSSQTVTEGGNSSTTYTTTITAVNGFTGTVSLSVSGMPSGVTTSFNPTSVTGSGHSTLSVSASSQATVGTYPLTIKGTSGSLIHSATVTLVVNSQN